MLQSTPSEAIMRIAKVLALTLAMGFAPGAGAIPWTEVGDAGDLPATAQVPTGSGALSSIFGSIPSAGAADADMYRIHISTPLTFSATTVGTVGLAGTQLENTELFLFNAAGIGVYGRDDDPGTARTTLPAGSLLGPLVPGDFFLQTRSAAGRVWRKRPAAATTGST